MDEVVGYRRSLRKAAGQKVEGDLNGTAAVMGNGVMSYHAPSFRDPIAETLAIKCPAVSSHVQRSPVVSDFRAFSPKG